MPQRCFVHCRSESKLVSLDRLFAIVRSLRSRCVVEQEIEGAIKYAVERSLQEPKETPFNCKTKIRIRTPQAASLGLRRFLSYRTSPIAPQVSTFTVPQLREELRPKIARYLSEHGPTRHQDMFKVKELAEYSQLGNVLMQLVWEGFLEEKRTRRTQRLPRYSLAQK